MSELNPVDQIFYILLIGGMILISMGGILYIIADIFERKAELRLNRLNKSFNDAKILELNRSIKFVNSPNPVIRQVFIFEG